MSNLNGLRQLISLAMRNGDKSITISIEMVSMIVVEYEKHRVAAKDAIDGKAQQFSELESIKRIANDLQNTSEELSNIAYLAEGMFDCEVNTNLGEAKEWKHQLKVAIDKYYEDSVNKPRETQTAAQRILKDWELWVYTGTDAMFKDPEVKNHE